MKIGRFISDNRKQIAFVLVFLLPAMGIWIVAYYHQARIGPEQPIAFSHRVHANDKEISCLFCHQGALETGHAGIPPLQTCMLCHERIIIHHPEIEKLRKHYESGQPVEWVQVEEVPDFVFFNHSIHVFRRIDCAECHGNVRKMDRIETFHEFKMDFCIDCHRKENATVDCFTCHR